MKNKTHVMVDIETLGTKRDATIDLPCQPSGYRCFNQWFISESMGKWAY